MNRPRNTRGHFASLWTKSGDVLVPTTITNQRKNKSIEKELAKRSALQAELRELTGDPEYATVAKRLDDVHRRWAGVKGNGAGTD